MVKQFSLTSIRKGWKSI